LSIKKDRNVPTLNPAAQATLSISLIFRPLFRYFANLFATRNPTQVEICTNGPSFPKHIPVATAKTAPKPFTNRTLKSRKFGITKPDRMVLISGIPEPAAMYIVFPVATGAGGPLYWSLSPVPGDAAGRERLVSIVALELMMPKARAKAT
jgi:hypothetical protein